MDAHSLWARLLVPTKCYNSKRPEYPLRLFPSHRGCGDGKSTVVDSGNVTRHGESVPPCRVCRDTRGTNARPAGRNRAGLHQPNHCKPSVLCFALLHVCTVLVMMRLVILLSLSWESVCGRTQRPIHAASAIPRRSLRTFANAQDHAHCLHDKGAAAIRGIRILDSTHLRL